MHCGIGPCLVHRASLTMSLETKFRGLSKRAAECQRHIGRLSVVDSLRLREEVASLVRSDLRTLENDIKVQFG